MRALEEYACVERDQGAEESLPLQYTVFGTIKQFKSLNSEKLLTRAKGHDHVTIQLLKVPLVTFKALYGQGPRHLEGDVSP